MPSLRPNHFLESLKLAAISAFGLMEMFYFSLVRPKFWWLRLRGRDDEVERIVYRIAQGWSEDSIRRIGCTVEMEGREHIPASGPLLVMCNHQSLYDIPILIAHLGRLAGFVAKQELFRLPGFSYWMRQIHSFSLDRANPAAAAKLFQQVSRWMKETGSVIVLFPEGTRTRDTGGRIGPFRKGSVRLATLQDIPILPISIDGTRFFSQPEQLYRTRGGGRLVRIRIAPLVTHHVRSARERRDLVERVRHTIVANYEDIRVSWPAQPAESSPLPAARAAKT
jgi:1-acyl-sn-glycerol-3-phosphate acyltransferase